MARNVAPLVVPTFYCEKEKGVGVNVWGENRRRFVLYSDTPLSKGGAQGPQTHWAPRTWHALGPSFPPPSLWRESFATGRHFQVFSAYEIYFCCRRAAAILSSHVTLEPARRRTRTDTKERIIWKKFCNFVSFFFFFLMEKVRYFFILGALTNILNTFWNCKLVRYWLKNTERLKINERSSSYK